jgi:steroid delta-isomerase-like uncharacterized protein
MPSANETPLSIALKFYEMYNAHDVDLLNDLLAPEYVGEVNGSKIVGLQAAKAVIGAYLTAFPDVHYDVKDTVAESDKVAVRWRAVGTHLGTFGTLPPTRKPVTMIGITIFEIKGEQIGTLWNLWDVQGLLGKLRP